MFALIVKDENRWFGYSVWNGFKNSDEAPVFANLSKPTVSTGGLENNRKTIQAMFYTTREYADSEVVRINQILEECKQPQLKFEVISVELLSHMVNSFK